MRNIYSGKSYLSFLVVLFLSLIGLNPVIAQINHNATATPATALIPVGNTKYYDNGGPGGGNANGIAGNYSNNLAGTVQTIRPRAGVGVFARANFLSFNLENTFDNLEIFDAATPVAPIGAARTGAAIPAGNPFTATNAQGALTFRFTSDNTGDRAGWDITASLVDNTGAAVTCAPFTNFKAGTAMESGFEAGSRAYYCTKTFQYSVSSDVNTQNSYQERFDSVVVTYGDGNRRTFIAGTAPMASKATQRMAPTGFNFPANYTYANQGVYRVMITLYNELGCSETKTFNVIVIDQPVFVDQ